MPDPHIEFWDAVNEYAESYHGGVVLGNTARQRAVVRVEAALEAAKHHHLAERLDRCPRCLAGKDTDGDGSDPSTVLEKLL